MHTTRSTFAPIAAAAVLIMLLAGQAAPARADVGSLLSSLTGQLGVSEDQALGEVRTAAPTVAHGSVG